MTEFEEDCMHHWGKVLTGEYKHYCQDWDYLPIDETCFELKYCHCDIFDWDMDKKNQIKEAITNDFE